VEADVGTRIPSENRSPTGCWVATIIERFEFEDEDTSNPRRRCRAWSNVVLVKARDRNHAYRKAMRYGELGVASGDWADVRTGRKGKWIFEGLSSLLPVYDEFDEDGSEILFDDHENITVGRVQSWVREKSDLEVFDDSDSA
jgi:hypothetical protein